jgi:hypothetical protein
MKTITAAQAIKALRKVVKGKENYVYEKVGGTQCLYLQDGKPSCGVGHVLVKLEVPIDLISKVENRNANVIGFHGIPISDDAAFVLGRFQNCQDTGGTWGQALRQAEEAYSMVTRINL